MQRWATHSIRAVMLGLAVMLLAACGGDDDAPSSSAPAASSGSSNTAPAAPATDKLTVALSQLPDLIDPRMANPQSKIHVALLFDHLVGLNREGTELSKETGIASNWESGDQKVWTFQLRNDFTFSTGETVTAEDVKFSLERVMAKEARSPYASWFQSNVDAVAAPAADRVVVTLKQPDFSLPYYLSAFQGTEGMVVPKAYVTATGDQGFAGKPVGSGPYVLKTVNPGVSLTYEWRGQPHPVYKIPRYRTMTFTSVPEQSSRTAMLETGEADLIDLDLAAIDPKTLQDRFNIFEKASVNVIGIQVHTQWKDVPVANEKIRQALALAINKDELNKAIYRGLGKTTGAGFVGSLGLGFKPIAAYPFDQAKARQLLAEAGYNKTPIELYAFDIAGVPGLSKAAQAVAGYWREVGVEVKLTPIDYASYRPLWFDKVTNGATGVIGIANGLIALETFSLQFSSDGRISYAKDPAFDALVAEMAKTTGNLDAYKAMTPKLSQYIHDHYMSIPILEVGSFYAGSKKAVPADWKLGQGRYDINVPALIRQ